MSSATVEHDPLPQVIEAVRQGRPIVLIDDRDRENEGDIMVAAELITAGEIGFMIREAKGLICLSLTESKLKSLGVPLQVTENSSPFGTNFGVSFDHVSVAGHGVSAAARARTILATVQEGAGPADFVMPGFVFPVCAVPGGVLKRRGQTEGSVDLARLAGLSPAGVICEIMGEDGQMVRGTALAAYCRRHNLLVTSVDEICQYRLQREVSLRRLAELTFTPEMGLSRDPALEELLRLSGARVRIVTYIDDVDDKEHLALIVGEPRKGALVRIHSECLTGDVFASRRCDCGYQLNQALRMILKAGEGVIVYLHQEGRDIGLGNKLRAYELQDKGYDTVDANLSLGFAADSRNYRAGAQILSDLGLAGVRLITNNPHKVQSLGLFGVEVTERVDLPVQMDKFNTAYLLAKRRRMGHLFPEQPGED